MLNKALIWKISLTLLSLLIIVGCASEPPVSPQPTDDHSSSISENSNTGRGTEITRVPPTMFPGCGTDSGLLLPNTSLVLRPMNSEALYPQGAVAGPTLVSFAICDLDTAGLHLAPKVAVFGPDPTQTFLTPVGVRIPVGDAGIGNTGDGTEFYLFKFDELNFVWQFLFSAQTVAGECRYEITRNGIYAVSILDSLIIDIKEWTTTGLVTPEGGGILNLLNSSFEVLPDAVTDSTLISFTIRAEYPDGLQGALPRVYEFEPEGLQFAIPATMTIAFEDAGYDQSTEDIIYLYYRSPENDGPNAWIRQPQPVEMRNGAFSVEIHHFSRYAFGR